MMPALPAKAPHAAGAWRKGEEKSASRRWLLAISTHDNHVVAAYLCGRDARLDMAFISPADGTPR